MLKNYIKIAWRNLIRDRVYSFTNIIGLTIGLSACMLLILFVRFQLSYDSFNKKADRIYRVTSITKTPKEVIKRVYTPVPLAATLKEELPGVEKATHLSRVKSARIKIGQKTISVENFYWADQDIFGIFSFTVLKGNKDTFLQNPNSIVVARSVADTYFRDENPLGKTIQLNDNIYTITGVFEDWPANSHFHPQFIATFSSLRTHDDESWYNFNTRTYFLLNEQASIKEFRERLPAILNKYIEKDGRKTKLSFTYRSQALTNIHLYSNMEGELEQNTNINTIYVVLCIALLILLNACANYINLSAAKSQKRSREVGIRKTFGSGRKDLILQFLGETSLVTGLSFLLSLIIIKAFIPIFNDLFSQKLSPNSLFDPLTIGAFLVIIVMTSLLAGLYPAFYLTSFSIEDVINDRIQLKSRFSFPLVRKGMIVFQFLLTISLIATSLLILQQLHFIQHKDLGFNEHNLVVIPLGTAGERQHFGALKNKLLENPDIRGITSGVNYPGRGYINQRHWLAGNSKGDLTQMGFVGPNFLKVFDINLIKGRDFHEKKQQADTRSVIVNETAVKRLGLGKNPIGEKISRSAPGAEDRKMYQVVGVAKDFNTESLREAIQPVVLYPVNFNVNMIVRVAPHQISKTIDFMRSAFVEVNPHASFEYTFVSDFLADYYRADENFFEIIISFTVLAIFIASIGLLGLVGYHIQDRMKELAIRKILGATITDIISLLSIDFVKLVLLAFVIAVPIAWYAMNWWLQDFVYRINIGPGIFAIAGGSALFIALATISWQTIRAALANPVESLRNE